MRKKHFLLPDLCQTTSLLLIILVTELGVLTWELLSTGFNWSRMGYRSLIIQWMVLLSASVLCKIRPWLSNVSVATGWFTAFSVSVIISTCILFAGQIVIGGWSRLDYWQLAQHIMAIAMITAMVLRYFQLRQHLIVQNKAELNSRLNALQSRIKPHFLFNSLNTIAELIATKPDAAESAVLNLSSLFRANLKEVESLCDIQQEIELIEGYLNIEQWRLGERLTIQWQRPAELQPWQVPVLSIQPIVENAIMHGIAASESGGTLTIAISQTEKLLTVSVTNTVAKNSVYQAGQGVALDNIRHRLSVIYGEGSKLTIDASDEQYQVVMVFPALNERVQ
ncbi:histidine kinase [Reinekea marina]|uniref:Sensor histidine kinase n=1 Tax=Reinekea marina TaxID=1310421 RepID=A0ABV7WLH6_9GAMM|nr:histidine kinase [Reinekea marina]MDN3648388.1 histidine kinase [Reinekea marina]